ncbi:MAG: ferredoxin [Desulfovibrionaceae bacterium]|nr:ferredoxin [Desulfovibrionaceae bacterium]MBF0514486.1 ferredoxin [Desulfovibrionaceae bacterium]
MSQDENPRPYFINPVCCNGCGACVSMEPELFGWDESGEKAAALLDAAPENAVRQAMAYCPHDCIEIEGEE